MHDVSMTKTFSNKIYDKNLHGKRSRGGKESSNGEGFVQRAGNQQRSETAEVLYHILKHT